MNTGDRGVPERMRKEEMGGRAQKRNEKKKLERRVKSLCLKNQKQAKRLEHSFIKL